MVQRASSRSDAPSPRFVKVIAPLLLFVSGAVALVYEVIWQRQFAVVFGSAAPATAAVLAAYFAGLGAGSWVVGRVAHRWTRPLRAYAILELFVGAGALLVRPLLEMLDALRPAEFSAEAASLSSFAPRLAIAFLALLLPTFCMGGTLPLLGRFVDAGQRRLGVTAGWLYVANTMGAGLGALSVPFLLLPSMGVTHTVQVGVGINIGLAALAWWADLRSSDLRVSPMKDAERAGGASDAAGRARGVLACALISGVVTFALQTLWNRAFAQVHENSMYSFAVIVAAVIVALALGAELARAGLRRGVPPKRLVGGAWMAGGAAVAIGPWLFWLLTGGLSYLPGDEGWLGHAAKLLGLALALLLAPMTLLGVGLPALMEEAGRTSDDESSRVLGRVLGVNIVGSVAGALLAGFFLPSWLGMWNSIVAVGALAAATGGWLWLDCSQRAGASIAGLWVASLLPTAALDLPRVRVNERHGERLVALSEGAHGITAVVEREGSRRLKLNNHYALGGTAATGDERMQAHLPLLRHPAPRSVAFLGLGTGITAGGALSHPVERLVAVELVPEVIAAARIHFSDANAGVTENGLAEIVADDARHHLRRTSERFAVIVGDLVVPWRQGEGALFTLEQFRAARDALAPNGLFCQWVPLFQLSAEETMILVRTFLRVFPKAEIWRGDFSPFEPAIALIGTADGRGVDAAQIGRRLAEMKRDPANPHLTAGGALWMYFVGEIEEADLGTEDFRINREDRPWIELLAPLRHGGARGATLFTGRQLEAWLDVVRRRSQATIERLPPTEAAAVAAGEALADWTLSTTENDRVRADAARERMKTLLPTETFEQLFPQR